MGLNLLLTQLFALMTCHSQPLFSSSTHKEQATNTSEALLISPRETVQNGP